MASMASEWPTHTGSHHAVRTASLAGCHIHLENKYHSQTGHIHIYYIHIYYVTCGRYIDSGAGIIPHWAAYTWIYIYNNKHVYRQSQVRMPNGCGVKWAECSLIIGTGCRVQVFSLILDSSVGLSVGIQSAGDLVSETLMGSNPALSKGRQLVSFRFEYRLPVPEHRN